MNIFRKYDELIKSIAYSDPKPSGVRMIGSGPILAIIVPFFAAIVIVSAIFNVLGLAGAWWIFRIFLSLLLLFGLFYSGYRFVYYRDKRNRE